MEQSIRTKQSLRIWNAISLKQYSIGLLSFALILAGTIQWQQQAADPKADLFFSGNYQSALEAADQSDKLVLLYFGIEYCYPCDLFLESSSKNYELATILFDEYVSVEALNSEEFGITTDLRESYGVQTFPALLVTDSDGKEIHRFTDLTNQEDLIHQLTALNNLRLAPTAHSNNVHSSASTRTVSSQANKKIGRPSIGLKLYQTNDYQDAIHQAELLKKDWNREIWIQSGSKNTFELILGTFDSRKKAKLTATYLKEWNHHKVTVIPLRQDNFNLHAAVYP